MRVGVTFPAQTATHLNPGNGKAIRRPLLLAAMRVGVTFPAQTATHFRADYQNLPAVFAEAESRGRYNTHEGPTPGIRFEFSSIKDCN
jgi:hypothetical protein